MGLGLWLVWEWQLLQAREAVYGEDQKIGDRHGMPGDIRLACRNKFIQQGAFPISAAENIGAFLGFRRFHASNRESCLRNCSNQAEPVDRNIDRMAGDASQAGRP